MIDNEEQFLMELSRNAEILASEGIESDDDLDDIEYDDEEAGPLDDDEDDDLDLDDDDEDDDLEGGTLDGSE